MTVDVARGKGTKLKLGKENWSKNPAILEVKIERLEEKVADNDRLIKEYQGKIQALQGEIRGISLKLNQNEKEKD